MQKSDLKKSILDATKWSMITEVVAKLVAPITNLILARLLAPEAFGVVATITMIISFADMFTDAGFQKYLVQNEFNNEEDKNNSVNVAFWTNLIISLILWGGIILFCDEIANLVGSPGLGIVIAISCIQLPLTSFSSIQMALFRRDFDFKTLFLVRIISICIPFIITIPLAIAGLSYWSLIIGTICVQLSNAVILTIKSKWKPMMFYDMKILRRMLNYSLWSLVEGISIWLSGWIDIFIIGGVLNSYYLGLYRTSITTVNLIFSLITSTIIPILFSTLSRVQNNDRDFKLIFYKNQKLASYLILPMGLGIFIYSDLVTNIALGNQWSDASYIIGIWGLTTSIKVIFSDFNSECFRAKGKPKVSFFIQLIHVIILIPTCIIALNHGFKVLVYARALIRLQLMFTSLLVMEYFMNISVKEMFNQVKKSIICCVIMGIVAIILRKYSIELIWSFISIVICIITYFITMLIIARDDFNYFINIIQKLTGIKFVKKTVQKDRL